LAQIVIIAAMSADFASDSAKNSIEDGKPAKAAPLCWSVEHQLSIN